MKTYKTRIVYKGDKPSKDVDTGLTEKEAQAKVQEDIDINPNCEVYMLVYDEE